LVDVSFNNLFGTARRFDIHWEKPDKYSENFFLRYTEPWLLDYPLDVSAGLERTVRDSTYIEWKVQLHNKWRYSDTFSLVSSIERQVVLPDSIANRDQRLVRYEQLNLEIGLEYDTRDYPVNPRQGIFIGHSYTLGLKNNYGPGYLLREDSIKTSEQIEFIKLHFDWYKELFRNQVLALKLQAYLVDSDRLQITDLVWFGGARTLRGYRENQFQGNIVSWINLEYRFLLARNSRIFVFNDWGAYQSNLVDANKNEILYGYGIGLRLDTALGIMAVDFGLGKNDGFSEGKIHFGIINRF
jgi:outer membrane protein insertion porin family